MNLKDKINPTTVIKAIPGLIPQVGITSVALNKMYLYIQECNEEVGWLGTVEKLQSGKHFIIHDVFLFDQNVSSVTTEITPEGLATFAEEILQRPDGMEVWNSMKVWGHSHVNMGISPSGQDDKQMLEFSNVGHDYFIRLIGNKKGEMKLDFYDFVTGITYLDIPWERLETQEEETLSDQIFRLQEQLNALVAQESVTLKEPIKEELKLKVKKMSYARTTYTPPHTHGTSGHATQTSLEGYRDHLGVFHFYDDLDPAKKKQNTSMTKKGNGQDGTQRSGNEKKTTDEVIVVEDDETILYYHNYFHNDDQVTETFSREELEAFSRERTFEDLQDVLEEYGYMEHFTINDIERIYRVAYKFNPHVQHYQSGR